MYHDPATSPPDPDLDCLDDQNETESLAEQDRQADLELSAADLIGEHRGIMYGQES